MMMILFNWFTLFTGPVLLDEFVEWLRQQRGVDYKES